MAKSTRIPRTITEFNKFITRTKVYLHAGTPVTNASRLEISEEECSKWDSFEGQWNPLYAKYLDKQTGYTTATKDELNHIIVRTVEYANDIHLMERIIISPNVTVEDLKIFNIKSGPLEKNTRTIPTTPIKEQLSPILLPIGGGRVTVKCYSTTSARASIYDDADSVQHLFTVGNSAPESIQTTGLNSGLSTRGIFEINAGAENSGKRLFVFLRWYNTKHPELAGPWSDLESTIIL